MTSVTVDQTGLPFGRSLTRADLERLPDDGHRYELIDGTLVVSPAPRARHQDLVLSLAMLLRSACLPELKVFVAPFAVALADDTELQPDVLVARRSQVTERDVDGPPVLAVEVLSPSTRRIDLLLKRDRLQAAGCPSYWLVDPDVPSVTVLELEAGRYVEVGRADGDERLDVIRPFPVSLVPADWRDD